MRERVILCNPRNETIVVRECETLADACDALITTIQVARRVDRAKFPSLLPRLRDQALLNIARWLTDGTFSDACREVFVQLCARRERSTTTTDVKLIAAFGVADALTAALDDPGCWPDFDAKFDEFARLMTSSPPEAA